MRNYCTIQNRKWGRQVPTSGPVSCHGMGRTIIYVLMTILTILVAASFFRAGFAML